MTSRRGLASLATLVLVVLAAVSAVAVFGSGVATATNHGGCTVITGPTVINQAGCYELGSDVADSPNETYVEIRASDVVLDGAGHTVGGTGSYDTIGIHATGSAAAPIGNVTVTNLAVEGWETGIYLRHVTSGVVRGVSATDSEHQGIQLRDASDVRIENVVTADNPGSYEGILVVRGSGLVVDNLTSAREGYGIQLYDVNDALVANSTFREGSIGVDLDDTSNVVIRDNAFENGGSVSVSGSGVAPNRVTNNVISGDRWDGYCGGFQFRSAEDDVVAHNTFDGCYDGIYIDDSVRITVSNNSIDNEHTFGNTNNYGIKVTGGNENVLTDNTVTESGSPGRDEPGITLGSTARATLSGNTLFDNPVNIRVRGDDWAEVNHDIDATNTVEGRPIYYYVNGSVGSVTVPSDAGWVGLVGTRSVTVADVAFPANNQENVYLWGAKDTAVRNVSATGSRYAIWADYDSDNLLLEDSTFQNAGMVYVSRSIDSRIADTTVADSGGNGVSLYLASGTTLENVTLRNSDAHGVQIKADSDYVSIIDSTIQSSDRSGLYTAHNTNLTVVNSTITDNGGGILATSHHMTNVAIRDTVISDNDGSGVSFDDYANHVAIANNVISGNSNDGINLNYNSHNNTVRDNVIADNAGEGLKVYSGNNTAIGNTITGHGRGIYMYQAKDFVAYDNHFNNTQNVRLGGSNATWNATATTGKNVLGGPSLGGNYWADPNGTGFSETCADADADGICDAAFALDGSNVDYLPLASLTGPAPAPDVAVSPTTIDFGGVDLGDDATESIVIENVGTAPLNVTGVEFNGPNPSEFGFGGSVTPTIAPGDTHTIHANYEPSSNASHEMTLRILTNDTDESAVDVALSGTGLPDPTPSTEPDVAVDPTTVDFGNVTVGESATAEVVVRNDGDEPLAVTSTYLDHRPANGSDAFSYANGGPSVLAPGANRTLTVTFEPTGVGRHDTVIVVSTNDTDESAVVVDLLGTGVGTPSTGSPEIAVSPAPLNFGDVAVGTYASDALVVSNEGSAPLAVTGRHLAGGSSGQFSVGGSPAVVAPGETVTFSVGFRPTVAGAQTTTLRVTSNDSDESSLDVPLTGSGIDASISRPEINVHPATVDFGGVDLTETETEIVTVDNVGTAPLDVTETTLGGADPSEFSLATSTTLGPDGSFTVAPGDAVTFVARYTPTTNETHAATVTFASNDSDESDAVVALTGTGRADTTPTIEPEVSLDPTAVDFGNVTVDGSATADVVVRNDGGEALGVRFTQIDYRPANGSDAFSQANGGGFTLAPGANRTVTVTFAPTAAGPHSSALVVTSNDSDEMTAAAELVGYGQAAVTPPASGGSGGASGGSGNSGSSGGSGTNAPTTPATSVDVTHSSTGVTDVAVSNARANDSVAVNTTGQAAGDVSLDGLDVTPLVDGDFTLNVSVHETAPSGAPTDAPTGETPVAYLNVDHSIADDDVGEVTFRFRVSKDRLTALGLVPEDVVVYRYHDGQWEAASMTVSDESADAYVLEATVPGLSVFAVSADKPTSDETPTEAPTETATQTETASDAPPTTEAGGAPEPVERSGFPVGPVLALLAVVAVAVAAWFVRR